MNNYSLLKTNSQGFQALYILLGINVVSVGIFNFTDINNPKLSWIGIENNVAYHFKTYIAYQMSVIIDTGQFLFYLTSIYYMNYESMRQATLFKIDYSLAYLNSWMSAENKLSFNIVDINYSFIEQPNLNFTCSIQTSLLAFDSISSQSYEFSDSLHSIWPRPYLKEDFQSYRSPQASFMTGDSNLIYNVNDSSHNIILNLCEQCQGIPINQTKILSISPNVDSRFLNFLPNGQLEIVMNEVNNIGSYSITIQNQIKLLNPNMTSYRIIDYIWDDPLNLNIEFINNFPKIKTILASFTIMVNKELSFNILFLDDEDDQVHISLNSIINTIGGTYLSVQTQK